MRVIVIEDESYDLVSKTWLIVSDGDIVYKDNVRHVMPLLTWIGVAILSIIIVQFITGSFPICYS
jgi:hypothetical protein